MTFTNNVADLKKRKLGKTDLEIAPVALGCWPIAGMTSLHVNDADSLATIHRAIDCGVNLFDTAFGYGVDGESERLIGRALSERRLSECTVKAGGQIVIASKAGMHWEKNAQGTPARVFDASPDRVVAQCEESLRRLKVEAIDLYYLHAYDPTVPIEQTATAFERLLQQGKIRSAGVSNLSIEQMERFESVCAITAVQPPYNMLQRDIEIDLIPWCQERSVSVINYWPLMKGLLAGKIRRGHEFEPADSRLKYDVFQGKAFEAAQTLLDFLDTIAEKYEATVAQIVVSWTVAQPGITATLCGAKRDWQIEDTAAAMRLQMEQTDLDAVSKFLASVV